MSINITTERHVIKIIKYSGVSLSRINRVSERKSFIIYNCEALLLLLFH